MHSTAETLLQYRKLSTSVETSVGLIKREPRRQVGENNQARVHKLTSHTITLKASFSSGTN